MMAGELGVVLSQGSKPVLCPQREVYRVYRDDGNAVVAGHVGEPVTEPGRWEPGDLVPERPAPTSPCGPFAGAFAALAAGVGEVQVLDHDGAGPVLAGGGEDAGDRGPQPPVPGARRQARQWQVDGERDADLVAIRVSTAPPRCPALTSTAMTVPSCASVTGGVLASSTMRRGTSAPFRGRRRIIAGRPQCGLRGNIAAPVGEFDRA
jgi:hypothetical protein